VSFNRIIDLEFKVGERVKGGNGKRKDYRNETDRGKWGGSDNEATKGDSPKAFRDLDRTGEYSCTGSEIFEIKALGPGKWGLRKVENNERVSHVTGPETGMSAIKLHLKT
jgi:hypothetical protein